ncbi:hypothetical protein RhiirA1_484697 [Rhizophagus irregularis]|uniref:Uncharacterized protein n=1 Tax=Rhizophagus irregularis TaxID=588596 RepID=A0A2N0QJ13_9GLOM|nr:hypothetical protein RhiirA1_484697 [Rhizophagus irregularis]
MVQKNEVGNITFKEGKQMERMRDGSQLAEDMRFPDPIEFDAADNDNDEKYNYKKKN